MGFVNHQEHEVPSSYILRGLQEVIPAEPVSWMPQTLGWKIVLVVCAVFTAHKAIKHVLQWWKDRYRREATEHLHSLLLNDVEYEHKLFIITKAVLHYLSPAHHSLFGVDFIEVLKQRAPNLQSDNQLLSAWIKSLQSRQFPLNNHERESLALWLVEWMMQHEKGTIGEGHVDTFVE